MSRSSPHRVIERALLGYVLVVIAVLTLSPFRFAWPAQWRVSFWGDVSDMPLNILLFLPVGYFFRLSLAREQRWAVPLALLFGTALSALVETTQLFLPARLCSLADVIGNGAGAGAGAVLCVAVRRRFDRTLPSVLTLEHPLLNLVYLTVPLMWLTGIGVEREPARVWLLAPLGAMGALTLSGLWRYRFSAAAHLPRPALAGAVLGWFLFGSVTGVRFAPLVVAQCAAGIFLLTLLRLFVQRGPRPAERRFEHLVLLTVWPCYLAYLAMLVLWPHHAPFEPFDLAFGYPERSFDRDFTLRIAEQLGALTLLGYLLAETFGRSTLSSRALLACNVALGALCALLMEVGHGFLPFDRASVARWLLGTIGSAFGVTLYAAQMSVMQLLRGGPTNVPTGAGLHSRGSALNDSSR